MNTQCNDSNCSLFGEYDCPQHSRPVSDPDERLDKLVQKDSQLSLASLYKRARAKGLIPARNDYH